MKSFKTELDYWICPDCMNLNSLFLVEDIELPERLECSFCDHISPEIEWEIADEAIEGWMDELS